jgi:hypothetical protein
MFHFLNILEMEKYLKKYQRLRAIINIHSPVTIINKNLHFKFIQLMMYIIFIIYHIHHLMNFYEKTLTSLIKIPRFIPI